MHTAQQNVLVCSYYLDAQHVMVICSGSIPETAQKLKIMIDEQLPPQISKGIYVQMPHQLNIEPLPLDKVMMCAREILAPLMEPATPMLTAMYRMGVRAEYERITRILK